ncbi:hypothetical protein BDV26DRAFT_275786 [Aspergillus bertholletiae]|uniref:Uncharacterized protein n=1 Tax=Aspergillus bertholletiae TaxID=1226010 RepID=A0A5N7ARS0_9EURO|nr:hypothetical protein BDV26DRAFT_275786 [Aspergillus bertholletiae]
MGGLGFFLPALRALDFFLGYPIISNHCVMYSILYFRSASFFSFTLEISHVRLLLGLSLIFCNLVAAFAAKRCEFLCS